MISTNRISLKSKVFLKKQINEINNMIRLKLFFVSNPQKKEIAETINAKNNNVRSNVNKTYLCIYIIIDISISKK